MYARLWSPILSQNDTSSPDNLRVPIARCMMPVSLMLSQDRRLRLQRLVMWDKANPSRSPGGSKRSYIFKRSLKILVLGL
uniref:Uncharacterized protein n=1 Tax=Anguilla anguilla TaxID=7936 RepID=A0A0E9VM19_ANGAN